jgi:hypothetical protein
VEPRKIPRRGRPPREIAGPRQDFAVTLSDGRRVVGRALEGDWSVYVYASDGGGRLLGYSNGRTRPLALEQAGLSGDDAGEALGRAGI